MIPTQDQEYEQLEARLKTLLPEEYQQTYNEVQPVSMGSAGLKFDDEGRVAWDEIWGSFCHLALAGGPPHRGSLLEPGLEAEINAAPDRHEEVLEELCRGIEMVTGLGALPSEAPGWIDVDCPNTHMAAWLARAITIENISTNAEGMTLHLPAGPHFRLEKEIKNVVTAIAKTCHYWTGHTSTEQHRAIAELFKVMDTESAPIHPPFLARNAEMPSLDSLRRQLAAETALRTSLEVTGPEYYGWLGIDCTHSRPAIWMMRIMVASNILARREGTLLYLPINPTSDPGGKTLLRLLGRAHRIACAQGVL